MTRHVRISRARKLVVLAGLSILLGGSPAHARTLPWDDFTRDFVESTLAAQPAFAVWAGRHEYDGRLPDYSRAGIRKEIARLRDARRRAAAYRDAALTVEQRFERDYLIAVLDGSLFWLETVRLPFRSPGYYYGLDPQVYVARDYAPLPQRMRAYIAYAKAIPRAVEQMRANLHVPMPRPYIRLGHILAGGLASLYEKDVPRIFAPVEDPALQEDLRAANQGAIAAMKGLEEWFTRQEARATDDFALGAKTYAAMLHATERLDVPLAHLEEIAERDLQRNLASLRKACEALAPGASVESCMARVQAQKPPDDAIKAAADQLAGLRAFVVDHQLVTIPGDEVAHVAETLPHQRWNSASIAIPGPFEKNVPSIYYITPPDPTWSQEERDQYIPGKSVLLFASVHEVWPGHFVQFQHARRSRSQIARLFGSYAFAEGWAHYTEEMMWDAGLEGGDPSAHIGQLEEALLRNVRLLSAIGLHTGGMTVAQSERMFREQAFQDPANARQQADRGTFDPGYGAYTLGKLMILKLREEWTASRGGRSAWQAFHDRLLSYGSPPLPLVRKAMLGDRAGPPL